MDGLATWQRLWREVGAPEGNEGLHQRLINAWCEPQRHYHSRQHLRECLATLATARHLAQRPAEVELALWFHDAFYEPRRHDNEERSAHWAREAIDAAGAPAGVGERVAALVMLTRGHQPPQGADGQLLVDVDLSILGAPGERFDESNEQIRLEYAHVPLVDFIAGRTRVLQAFLARPRLFCTAHFHDRLEAQARANLQRALDKLAVEGHRLSGVG
ncbi:N-methyl-D-aspartate receptor NMDAR2C subunit [Caenimonas koreensis]|uniref:N-methyl-D-aspartate receptor NMDAR2C subunit n=1 Tax=Caenimonas koreensis DSM 17982 TaxID=1121255 RepID=A0A844B7N5_9BURK|nr:N-methyl-D-aspartate receptor NMDAR2C subunit [Caenimonas koreensis]MRD49173.1 N-methyl-D-aspartate receptor NMDAR2C subunit [Caenimonas koreensis DSM 17982]